MNDAPLVVRLPHVTAAPDDPVSRADRSRPRRRLLRACFYEPRPGLDLWEQRLEASLARCVAAMAVCPSAIALTHEAAALVHGLGVRNVEPDIHLAVPSSPAIARRPFDPLVYDDGRRGQVGRRVLLVRSVRSLREEDLTTVAGLPVTTLERTALDCAMDLPVRESVCVLDTVMRRLCAPDRWTRRFAGRDPEEVRRALLGAGEAVPARRGVRRARAAIGLASPWSDSPGESVLRWTLASAGLPAPVPQHLVEDDAEGCRYFADLAWPQARLALEFDGYGKYGRTEDLRREKRRELRMGVLGWSVVRFDWRDLRDPDDVVGRVLAASGGVLRRTRPRVDLGR